MVKCDLHVHSKYTEKTANWLAKKFGIPESYTEPLDIYNKARQRGMTHVTITDHDAIGGCLAIMHLPDTFISCEVTAHFPEDKCKIHVLTYDITEGQHQEINLIRKNIYELISYLDKNNICYAVAHPFFSVNNKLTRSHIERMLVLFDRFEINGFRSRMVNNKLTDILKNISTTTTLEELADTYKVDHPKTNPVVKSLVCGTDDHSGVFIASSYTSNPGDSYRCLFTEGQYNEVHTRNSEPADLAYAIYSIIYQSIEKKVDVHKYIQNDDALKNIATFLTLKTHARSMPLQSLIKSIFGNMNNNKSHAEWLLKNAFNAADSGIELNPDNVSRRWMKAISKAIDASARDLLEYSLLQLQRGHIFNIFRSLGSITAIYFLSLPYYISYRVFQETRALAENTNFTNPPPHQVKVAHFTDTYNEINGVARTMQQMMQCANKLGLDYTFITCGPGESRFGEKVFKPVKVFDLPEYPTLQLSFPSVLDITDYCYQQDFTHIHAATPGPLGLVGLLIAKLFKKPFYASYHTALPDYALHLTGEETIQDIAWTYMRWFYGAADKVFVPSESYRQELVSNGIADNKIILMPRGIDIERFTPRNWHSRQSIADFDLLYVGRVSREKGLDVLITAFEKLNRPDISLTIVGDGPYRQELQDSINLPNVKFRGYLEGEELVNAYRNADLFVFPSTTDTFGNVVLEAHACGLPTIVTDQGGPRENVLHGETGLIVPGNEPDALRDAIASLLDTGKLRQMGSRAREVVSGRTFDKAFVQFYQSYV